MKLNNKGMSIIEIVLSFALIMVMVVSMLTVVVNYRNKAQLGVKKLKLDTFKNNLTQDVQNDILKRGLVEINNGGECEILKDSLSSCVNLVFQDHEEKAFGVSKLYIIDPTKNRETELLKQKESIENKYLYYDGIKYKVHEVLPDLKKDGDKIVMPPTGRDYIDLQSIVVENGNILTSDSAILEDGTNVSLYSIDVYISHADFSEDFGIHIVASTDDISL